MKSKILFTTMIILASCTGSKNKVNVDVGVNANTKEVANAEATDTEKQADVKYKDVLTRVKHIYSVWFNDSEYDYSFFSKEHKAISEKGCKLAEGCWGAECVFWTLTQDYGDNIKLKSATIHEVKNDTAVVVKCVIDLDLEDAHNHTVYLTMIKEDGQWVGDDCCNEDFSYKECNLEAIKCMMEENEK
ncbi:MAG: hypothetical protein J5663_10625 [Bacteroidaceae bacterium]|nr:hypothetical protein [Bacteroidaceae bacterium]